MADRTDLCAFFSTKTLSDPGQIRERCAPVNITATSERGGWLAGKAEDGRKPRGRAAALAE